MNWDPAKHPRKPRGTPEGGEFARGDLVTFQHKELGKVYSTVVLADRKAVVTAWAGLGRRGKSGLLVPTVEYQINRPSKVFKMLAKSDFKITPSIVARAPGGKK